MRKIILLGLMAAIAIPAAATAQSRGEIRRDRDDVREQRDDLRDAQERGDRRDMREEREELRDARQELREDQRDRRDEYRDNRDRRDEYRDNRDRRSQYVAPYRGWRYGAVRPGFQLRPGFYGPRYQINNPGHYRLRAGTRNQRWIRYGNDLLLVNVRNGRVLQVVSNRY
jgi:Ni/Co efflux regulator RcnB